MNQVAVRANPPFLRTNQAQWRPSRKASVSKRLATLFRDYFEVVTADTPELLEIVHQLRYQIYCEETGFEDSARYPDRLEKDEFDDYAVHSLLRHRETGLYIGTVRLILPRPDLKQCFPIQQVAAHPIFFEPKLVPRSQVAEISRFAISKDFKKRVAEFSCHRPRAGGYAPHPRSEGAQILPYLILGLFTAMVRMSVQQEISHWFCVMEPALVRLLSRHGLHFVPYGATVEYHGKRQPCYVRVKDFLSRAHKERPDVWELITDDGCFCPSSEKQANSRVIRFPHNLSSSKLWSWATP